MFFFFFSSRRRHTRCSRDWSSDVCSSDLGGGAGTGDRLPLIVYRVYPDTGREEMVRGARLVGLSTRTLRNIAGIGNDDFVFNHVQRSEEHTSELQSRLHLVCRLLLEKKKNLS